MWDKIISVLPDTFKSLFGLIDKIVTDKDKANELKLSLVQTMSGQGAQHWLQANAFSLAMISNFVLIIALTFMGRDVPDWSLLVALAWLAGPLLNSLSKDTVGRLFEVLKENKGRIKK